jgi:hypothetical protein
MLRSRSYRYGTPIKARSQTGFLPTTRMRKQLAGAVSQGSVASRAQTVTLCISAAEEPMGQRLW